MRARPNAGYVLGLPIETASQADYRASEAPEGTWRSSE